jgi:hypothetical protein
MLVRSIIERCVVCLQQNRGAAATAWAFDDR